MATHPILLIFNPNSDRGRSGQKVSDLRALIDQFGGADWRGTEYPGHATEIAAQAGAYRTVVALGGDGTVHEVVNGLMQLRAEHRPPLGVVAIGACHDFAFGARRPLASPLSLMMTLIVGLGFLCPVGAWLATVVGAPWYTGALVGLSGIATYLVYERVHFRSHFRPATTGYARWQQRRHLAHHASAGTTNFGVTSPVWDWAFGTYEPVPSETAFPARLTAF